MLARSLVDSWQRTLWPRPSLRHAIVGRSASQRSEATNGLEVWSRVRDRVQFHLGRARRLKDRGNFRQAAREIERALKYDDTRADCYQVLAQCRLHDAPPDLPGAGAALQRAMSLKPGDRYTGRLMLDLAEARREREVIAF
jgi:hypothetical protein